MEGIELKRRQIVETIAAVVFMAMALLTVFVPDWIEEVSPLRPDSGGGETEWLIVVALGALALILAFDVFSALRRASRPANRVSPVVTDES